VLYAVINTFLARENRKAVHVTIIKIQRTYQVFSFHDVPYQLIPTCVTLLIKKEILSLFNVFIIRSDSI